MRRAGLFLFIMVWSAASAASEAVEGSTGMTELSLGRPDIDVMVIESRLYKIQQTFSGKVSQTEDGLALLTESGVYKLNGISLGERIGEEVSVTGILRDDTMHKSLYVIKIDKKP